MYVKKISLENYRNYERLELDFDSSVNIIIGDNANGKTNILESIYLSATSKSNRLSSNKEIIRLGCDYSIVKIDYEREGISRNTIIKLNKDNKKEIAIDGEVKKKLSSLLGNIFLVFFSPDDLELIQDAPAVRRRFLDIEICQIDRYYLKNLSNYQKILKARNILLKGKKVNKDLLAVYDEELAKYGKYIIDTRQDYIKELDKYYKDIHFEISGKKEQSEIKYKKNVSAEEFLQKLEENHEKDIEKKHTSVGPHKDDFVFISNDKNLRNFGSRGQIRTAVLSVKLAEIEIIKNRMNIAPILLLDDVLSELDEKRQTFLIEQLKDIQTIITGTGVEDFILKKLGKTRIYKVENNEVSDIKR